MKKIITILSVILLFGISQNAFAFENIEVIEPEVIKTEQPAKITPAPEFDWLELSDEQKQAKIEEYKNILFSKNTGINYSKSEFASKFKNFKKDKEYKHHYMLTNNGVTEDEDAKYCAFYYKKNTLVIYAIQYKTNPHQAFYYTAFGKLYYVDVTSDEYPNFPYYSMQYDRKGKLKSAIYFVSKDIQYMFEPNGEFQGVWYKDKMYNSKGEQKLTRSNW